MADKIGDARHLKDEIKDLVGKKLPICIDVDGTVVFHHYPKLGKDAPHCVKILKKWTDNGVGLIIDTMRSGKELDDAVKWFKVLVRNQDKVNGLIVQRHMGYYQSMTVM